MTTITSLPTELLLNILNRLDKLSDAAECRRVCKAWSNAAERLMLGQPISIPFDSNKQLSLYNFLLRIGPAESHLLKHLHFDRGTYEASNTDLLKHIAASNIESITGHIEDDDFFNSFMDVVESSPKSFDKLNTLKVSCSKNETTANDLALHCKDTIQTLQLNFVNYGDGEGIDWDLIDGLDKFQHLTSLTLEAIIESVEALDEIVDNCPHLQELSLSVSTMMDSDDEVELGGFKLQAVEKHPNLKTLMSRGDFSHFAVEYFIVKFPSLEKISLYIPLMSIKLEREVEFHRISTMIQGIPQKELIYPILHHDEAALMPEIVSFSEESGLTTAVEEVSSYESRIKIIF